MNERFKVLAEQATSYKQIDGENGFFPLEVFDKEKFAELIVKECMTKVSEWDMGIDDPVGVTDNTSEVARDIVAEIKKHFGVTE